MDRHSTLLSRLLDAAGTALGRVLRRLPGRRAAAPALPTDPLTGLLTREAFESVLDEATHRCDQAGSALAVMYLDLDSLRLLNDAYGHATGDRVLASMPARLQAAVPALLAASRVAGDEFMLALPGGSAEAQAAALRLRDELRRPLCIAGQELSLSASIGIALYPQHGARTRLMLQAATAMRSVKQVGGGAHAEFEPAMGVDMRQQAELLRDLRQAVAQGRLQLVYQPKIDARSLQVTAAEALLRWHHPQRGVVSPAVFVPLAERHGLMPEIGRWVIEEACRQAGAWRRQGLHMRVAVNVSGHQLRQDGWVGHLCECLQRHGVHPGRFTCEITESVAMEDTQVTRQAFERLREAGIHVSIDDFGTGHSSLAMLRKLPAAELKIDRAFVTDLDSNADARSIAETIVRMAHQLELRVVAEGVETEAQRDWLLQMGCDELQGFLFAKPMSPSALAIWASGEHGPSSLGFRDSLFSDTALQ
ncbi:MAG: bifunctional diguanylate cyclase/phosphodiesterase [Rubrivivax sp.]